MATSPYLNPGLAFNRSAIMAAAEAPVAAAEAMKVAA